jgi:hypothetical protein
LPGQQVLARRLYFNMNRKSEPALVILLRLPISFLKGQENVGLDTLFTPALAPAVFRAPIVEPESSSGIFCRS